ncbi:hypothetical protein AS149_25885 [Burkholderia cenocepacia]|nr:hypothetical protein AS149_25885 [Burkholderia cenocepacia]
MDGYTRLTLIRNGIKAAPEGAWLGVIDVDTPADLDQLYDTVDSKFAVKRGRDAFDEGMRRAGLLGKVTKPVFTRAQAVSAVTAAAGHNDVRKAVWEMRKGIRELDAMPLATGATRLPSGALAALLLIASHGANTLQLQIVTAALADPSSVSKEDKARLAPVFKAIKALEKRRQDGALSGKNVTPIMELVLGMWMSLQTGASDITPVTRSEFLAAATA